MDYNKRQYLIRKSKKRFFREIETSIKLAKKKFLLSDGMTITSTRRWIKNEIYETSLSEYVAMLRCMNDRQRSSR